MAWLSAKLRLSNGRPVVVPPLTGGVSAVLSWRIVGLLETAMMSSNRNGAARLFQYAATTASARTSGGSQGKDRAPGFIGAAPARGPGSPARGGRRDSGAAARGSG